MAASDNIFLSILTPEKTLVEVNVEKVTLPGAKGRFMVLQSHAPVITSLEEGDVVYVSAGVLPLNYTRESTLRCFSQRILP